MANQAIYLDGLKDTQRAIRQFGGGGPEAQMMNKAVVDEMLVPPSKVNAPKKSGRLAESIRSDASAMYGYVLAGVRGPVEYAGVIHFGWSSRGMGRNAKGRTNRERRDALMAAFEKDAAKHKNWDGYSRRGIRKIGNANIGTLRGPHRGPKLRGGPIRPQPFIYQAIDSRHTAVFEFYERQLEQRARIEDLL